jgi:hypothetical protein
MKRNAHPAQSTFRPPLGLGHRHVQSILGSWPLRKPSLRRRARGLLAAARPEVLDCGAGVRLLGYYSGREPRGRGLVIMLHGWEGSADANYVISAGGRLFDSGFDVFRLNFRDHGATQALNEDLFHSCRIDEVVNAVRVAAEIHAAPSVFLVGHSLGGNFALRVAARAPQAGIRLSKVVAVCPVLRPHSTMRALEHGLWVYRDYFLRRWRRSLAAKALIFPSRYDFGNLRRFPTLTKTTEFFVKHYTEFSDLDAYLNGYAVTGPALTGLTVPTRLIMAADDPVVPIADLADLATNGALEATVVRGGGHCAFLDGYGLESWLDRAVLDELESHTGGA